MTLFETHFREATRTDERPKGLNPFPYQSRLASEPWPTLIDVPTGLGKTAAVVCSWLHRSLTDPEDVPRRLIYCLPTRSLVEQTAEAARGWVKGLESRFAERAMSIPSILSLMGGHQELEWVEHPERRAIVVGTQDMLLSRALMRGYAMSRFKWPIHFAWLQNDALWVFDEIQLMGVGVETSAQLQAFRDLMGTARPTHSIWMSATLETDQLGTINHPQPEGGWDTVVLGSEDRENDIVRRRLQATKRLKLSEVMLPEGKAPDYGQAVADRALELHRPNTLTLVLVNRVNRAQEIYRALLDAGRNPGRTALLHSRFRLPDRANQFAVLEHDGDRIVVSTQVLEAGVDVSAATMLTELAPWPSMVQRLGRCNRYGESEGATVEWIDLETPSETASNALPYRMEDLEEARRLLETVEGDGVGPAALSEIDFTPPVIIRPVIRRKDIVDLFDTTPDLSGNDLDVSRWIRDDVDTDVSFFWRDLGGDPPATDAPRPTREELCSVTISAARRFLKPRKDAGWRFDRLEGCWKPIDDPRPGNEVLLDSSEGGYDPRFGWLGSSGRDVVPVLASSEGVEKESYDDDHQSMAREWVSLSDHLSDVSAAMEELGAGLSLDEEMVGILVKVCRWHDVGKAHEVFQATLLGPVREDGSGIAPPPTPNELWAKSNHWEGRHSRPHFRHELASALAFLQQDPGEHVALVGYLIAAHHGKVRLSIRSLPGEKEPDASHPTDLFARGIWHGDRLPRVDLGNGSMSDECVLDLTPVRMGPGSWFEQMVELRDSPEFGPFRLAWLEALVRVADARGSGTSPENGATP